MLAAKANSAGNIYIASAQNVNFPIGSSQIRSGGISDYSYAEDSRQQTYVQMNMDERVSVSEGIIYAWQRSGSDGSYSYSALRRDADGERAAVSHLPNHENLMYVKANFVIPRNTPLGLVNGGGSQEADTLPGRYTMRTSVETEIHARRTNNGFRCGVLVNTSNY